jgi:hypothetical protein
MGASGRRNDVLKSEHGNAVLSWLLLASVAATAVESFMDGDLLWAVFPAVVLALALVVAVELDVFTPVRMPAWFAVLSVVIATMATAGGEDVLDAVGHVGGGLVDAELVFGAVGVLESRVDRP